MDNELIEQADDPPVDVPTVDVQKEEQVRYWSKTLRVHPAELRAAVDAVGPVLDDVRAHLRRAM